MSFFCAVGCAHAPPSQPAADTRANVGAVGDARNHDHVGARSTERRLGDLHGDGGPGGQPPAVVTPSGAATAVAPHPTDRPRGRVLVGAVEVRGGNMTDAQPAVARRRGRFHACYEQGLNTHPAMQGSIVLIAAVGADGQVTKVSGGVDDVLAPIVPCLKAVLVGAGFAPPDGGDAKVSVTITCSLAE